MKRLSNQIDKFIDTIITDDPSNEYIEIFKNDMKTFGKVEFVLFDNYDEQTMNLQNGDKPLELHEQIHQTIAYCERNIDKKNKIIQEIKTNIENSFKNNILSAAPNRKKLVEYLQNKLNPEQPSEGGKKRRITSKPTKRHTRNQKRTQKRRRTRRRIRR